MSNTDKLSSFMFYWNFLYFTIILNATVIAFKIYIELFSLHTWNCGFITFCLIVFIENLP